MFRNVIISHVGSYLPKQVLTNEHFVPHFNAKGIKSRGLYNAIGRDIRHHAAEGENTFTMGLEAAKAVLAKSNTDVKDIDAVIFVSDAPEYLAPTTALALHSQLGTINAHYVFDMNQNCTGMIAAIDTVSRQLKTNKRLNKALLVSAFHGSLMANDDDPATYGTLSDGASAVILDVVVESKERGVLDSEYKSDPIVNPENPIWKLMVYPECGLSKLDDSSVPYKQKKLYWGHKEAEFLPENAVVLHDWLLKNNNLKPTDVEHYIVSQFEPDIAEALNRELGIPMDRFTSTHREKGYIGNSSPMLTYEVLLEQKDVKKGEKLIVSSIGSGYTMSAFLYQF